VKTVLQEKACSVYLLSESRPRAFVVSTPETRQICNDPLLYGVKYTEALKTACTRALPHVGQGLSEGETSVVHLLRGGLNFGLREALASAFDWNAHFSTFLSAQRRRQSANPEAWEIEESEYRKLAIPRDASLVMGDVVASGASLQFGVESMLGAISDQKKSLRSILFFTIGGPRTEEVFRELDERIRREHPDYEGTTVVYFEGRFPVAHPETPLTIKITGTDLLRHGSHLAPEFIESQYESPMFPVERCTIYDAGSRAFEPDVYLEDVMEYWQAVAELNQSFQDYLRERFPTLDASRYSGVGSLAEIATRQSDKIRVELAR
jgi:hypothetical protein